MCNTTFPHRFWSCLGPGTSEAENGVRDFSLWGALLGVEKTVIERIEFRVRRTPVRYVCVAYAAGHG